MNYINILIWMGMDLLLHKNMQSMTLGKAQPRSSPLTKPLYSASSDSIARLPLKPWTAILSRGAALCPLLPGLPSCDIPRPSTASLRVEILTFSL